MAHHDQHDITFFAKTNFRNKERVFGIKTDDRRRHMYVIGKTGMGKTNLLENLAIQDIQKGHGIAFIDPHGDTAEKLIKAIPSNRINDVIYLNPSDQEFPIAFNVMEKVDPEYRHLVASGLVGVFKKIWADSWGPRLEYILRNAILALLEYPGSTLLGVTRILVDKSYRARVVEKITDPVVRSFWVDEFSQWNDRVLQEVISPIQNKVGQFLSSSLIRNIVGQTVSSFNIREAMDSQKILIINLSKGRIGEDNGALLGAMMITKIQLAAMGRVDIPEEDRKDFYLYVDEFQNFATESFANILSEARKYHLNLILANQYVTQIDETVRDAIFGNAGSLISFRVGAMDAEFLEKEFEPVFMMNDIINLPKYQIYLKLMIDGIAGDAFSATTLPPIKLEDAGNEAKIIQSSRERYSSGRAEVEDKIRRWSGMLTAEERQAIVDEQKTVPRSVSAAVSAPAPAAKQPPKDTPYHEKSKSVPTNIRTVRPQTPPASDKLSAKNTEEPLKQDDFKPALAPKRAPFASLADLEPQAVSLVGASVEIPRPVTVSSEQDVVSAASEMPVIPEKKLYPAHCASCGADIEVPFVPDGKRPTFCKDCLRDYQRSVAKARNEIGTKGSPLETVPATPPPTPHARVAHLKTYTSSEAPMSLAQMGHIGPKKFKSLHHRPAVNLSEVRALIDARRKAEE
ncbi:MAG: CxxC-x17-CxxC domain-containing protein [Candidatus Moraniibacteriota bacterium]